MRGAVTVVLVGLLAGCAAHEVVPVAPAGAGETLDRFPQERASALDILLVIDDPAPAAALAPDLVLALADPGVPGLSVAMAERHLGGRALVQPDPARVLRPGAHVLLVVLARDEAAVAEQVRRLVDGLRDLTGDRVLMAAVLGDRDTGCAPLEQGGGPSGPLAALAAGFGDAGVVTAMCGSDLGPIVGATSALIVRRLGPHCLRSRVMAVATSLDIATPVEERDFGVWCTVTDHEPDRADRLLAPCAREAARPCWRARVDLVECPRPAAPQGLRIEVERDPGASLHGLTTEVRCLALPPRVPFGQEP